MKHIIYLAVFLQTLNCSAYTPYECGNSRTASGTIPCKGRTVAADHLPFGTKVTINGHSYIVEDRFGGGYTDRLDIFMNSYDQAIQFGRQWIKCKIETPE